MSERRVRASVTRCVDLPAFAPARRLHRATWRTGDVVLGRVRDRSRPGEIEAPDGRMVEVVPGELVVGALGEREATLETVGSWRAVRPDLVLHALTGAGVLGRCTSHSHVTPLPLALDYAGHVVVEGRPLNMRDGVADPPAELADLPVVLLVGTSMSAGKTTAARAIVRRLKHAGLRVAGAKLTGIARYRDVLSMRDAGADAIVDFVDGGLPSTICPEHELEAAVRTILALIAAADVDVLVAEAGASPSEPYGGATVLELLRPNLWRTVLCASDPYAVVGVMEAFGLRPDLVSGLATSTSAGIRLVEELTGLPAVNVLEPNARCVLDDVLSPAALLRGPAASVPRKERR